MAVDRRRTARRMIPLLAAVATLPAALPPLVGVLAFLLLYGESGVVTRLARAASGARDPKPPRSPWASARVPPANQPVAGEVHGIS